MLCGGSGSCTEAIACSQRAIALAPEPEHRAQQPGAGAGGTRTSARRRRRASVKRRETEPTLRGGAEQPRQRAAGARRASRGSAAAAHGRRAAAAARRQSLPPRQRAVCSSDRWRSRRPVSVAPLALQPDYPLAQLAPRDGAAPAGSVAPRREASCRAVLAADPNHVAALCLLGDLHADRGEFAAGAASCSSGRWRSMRSFRPFIAALPRIAG